MPSEPAGRDSSTRSTRTRSTRQPAAVEDLFKSKLKGMTELLAKIWMHSLATGHANMLVAQTLGIEESDDFFVMGLLHDIGKLAICLLIQQGFDSGLWNPNIVTPKVVLSLLANHHNEFGAKLVTKWKYPQEMIDVVAHHNDDENIHKHSEPVVVTYYSNVLTRKLGHSLHPYAADLLSRHDLAQALNMTAEANTRIEQSSEELIKKIQKSYF